MRQDQVQALEEFLEIDLKVRTALDVLHRADCGMDHRDLGLRRGQCALHESLDLGHAG